MNTFCCSPLGSTDPQDSGSLCVGLLEKQGKQVKQVRKYGTSKIASAAVALRGLTNYEVLSADLLGGLENIHLEKEFSPLAVLKKMLKKI